MRLSSRLIATIVFASLSLWSGAAAAADAQGARMEAAFAAWVARYGVANASLAVMRSDGLIGSFETGDRTRSTAVPVASLSKAITGVCVVKLVEAGRLSYDARLSSLIPGYFSAHRPADAAARAITVRQLLTHASGLSYDPTQGTADFAALDFTKKNMPEQLALALARPLGARTYVYNNINFVALGVVIESVTGRAYEDVCGEMVLKPAGVVRASLNPPFRIMSSYGGWRLSALDYARFLNHFRPASALLSTQPVSWPRYVFDPSVFYSTGTFERINTSSYNFWHSGAWYWNQPGRPERSANFGAYFAVLRQNVRWVATYAPQPPSGALSELDNAMYNAALPPAQAAASRRLETPAPALSSETPPLGSDRGVEDREIGRR